MREWPGADGAPGGWRPSGAYVAWLASSRTLITVIEGSRNND